MQPAQTLMLGLVKFDLQSSWLPGRVATLERDLQVFNWLPDPLLLQRQGRAIQKSFYSAFSL